MDAMNYWKMKKEKKENFAELEENKHSRTIQSKEIVPFDLCFHLVSTMFMLS